MSILDGFEVKKLVIGSPSMTVTENGISFNKSAISKLGYPQYVKILIDPLGKRLAIQICSIDDENKVRFVKSNKDSLVRWNYHDFTASLQKWVNKDMRVKGFKIPAHLLAEEKALLFDFNLATMK